jgi:kynureninase
MKSSNNFQLDHTLLDKEDNLASYKNQFHLPPGKMYFCGHSLGLMPLAVQDQLINVLQKEWGDLAVSAWNRSRWIHLAMDMGKKIAPLIGCHAHEVIFTDSISINLYKVIIAALKLNHHRKILLIEENNFPADLYIAQGVAKLLPEITIE